MAKNAIVGQSGGPTSVINASLAGVYESCKRRGAGKVYGMLHGVAGLLERRTCVLDDKLKTALDIELLKRTPSSYLGSCRYKLPDWHTAEGEAVYVQLFEILKELDIGYFFYIGGNDSMDTISKLSVYGKTIGSEIRFIGVPKTIDNDLLLTDHAPGGSLLDVTSDTLLAAAAARAGITENANALPLGRSLYGYWARADVLNALLGDGAAAALQTANWEEWSDFVETLSAWMAEPKAATVTLSGADYTLPDARPGSLTATGVFAAPLDRASGYTAALLAADGTYTADALTGPLNGVYSAVTLEWDHMATDGGEGIFRRAKLTDLLAEYGADTCNGLVLVPFKCQLDDSDLTAEDYNVEGLLNYPVLADVGSIAINAGTSADGLKAAKSAALWLYSNGAGEDALTETLGVVTPWNTAAGHAGAAGRHGHPARRGAGHCSRRCPDCQRVDPAGQRKAHQGRAHRLCGRCIGRAGGGVRQGKPQFPGTCRAACPQAAAAG